MGRLVSLSKSRYLGHQENQFAPTPNTIYTIHTIYRFRPAQGRAPSRGPMADVPPDAESDAAFLAAEGLEPDDLLPMDIPATCDTFRPRSTPPPRGATFLQKRCLLNIETFSFVCNSYKIQTGACFISSESFYPPLLSSAPSSSQSFEAGWWLQLVDANLYSVTGGICFMSLIRNPLRNVEHHSFETPS